jgi:hypothetical protein
LTDDTLAFYEQGSSTPHWYSRRAAYGTAQDGDYIELNWDKKPKVITAISSLMSYNSSYSEDDQIYISRPSGVTADGFSVTGKSVIQGASSNIQSNHSYSKDFDDESVPDSYTHTFLSSYTMADTTALEFDVDIYTNGLDDGTGYQRYIADIDYSYTIKYENNSGTETTIDNGSGNTYRFDSNDISDDGYMSYHDTIISSSYYIDDLPEDTYRIKIIIDLSYNRAHIHAGDVAQFSYYENVNNMDAKSQTVIDNGEVMWIAIEGGAE